MQQRRDSFPASTDDRLYRATLLHDINNLLVPVAWVLNDLRRGKITASKYRGRISAALECINRVAELAGKLSGDGDASGPLESVNIRNFLTRLEKIIASALDPQGALLVSVSPGLHPIKIDPQLLERAILNLVVNARDAMPRNGTLSISAGMAERECGVGDDFVYIAVSDTGIGMDAATLQRARQPRFSTKVNGEGLGLAMVGDFVARHGGRWSIASEQDAGTTVTLLLPVDTGCKNEHMVAEPPQTRQRRPVFYVSSSD